MDTWVETGHQGEGARVRLCPSCLMNQHPLPGELAGVTWKVTGLGYWGLLRPRMVPRLGDPPSPRCGQGRRQAAPGQCSHGLAFKPLYMSGGAGPANSELPGLEGK